MRFFRQLIVALAVTLAFASPVLAEWPTACVTLNDIVEAHLGNHGNVGIYQRVFGEQAEQACQSDHRDDVRTVFAWAFDGQAAGPIAPTPWPSTCVALNDIVEAHLGNTGNVQIYQRTFGPGPAAESACQRDHRADVRGLFAWAFDERSAAVIPEAPPQAVTGHQEVTPGSSPLPTPCAGSFGSRLRTSSFAQWSANGAVVVFSHDAQLYAVVPDGSRLRHITDPGTEQRQPLIGSGETAFSVSPDGERLVYATCESRRQVEGPGSGDWQNQQDLVVASLNGAYHRRLTVSPAFESFPSWSPDGARVAYVAIEPASSVGELSARLHVVQEDGANARALPGGFDFVVAQTPVWSPDGRWLAVTGVVNQRAWHAAGRARGGLRGLGVLHLVSTGSDGDFIRLSEAVSGASWSPDGERLAFARPDGHQVALYTVAANGANLRRLTAIEGWRPSPDADPADAWIPTIAWSPDGSRILYHCGGSICVVDVDGSVVARSPRTLADGPLAATWSPDGSRLAVIRLGRPDLNRPQRVALYTMPPDASDVRILVRHDAVAADDRDIQRFLVGLGTPRGLYVRGAHQTADDVDVTACRAGIAVPDPEANAGLVADCEILLILQATLAGTGFLGWTAESPVTAWDGVELAGAPLRVHGLALPGRGLWSQLPPEIGELPQLRKLDLRHNYLDTTIPRQLGRLTHLTVLNLGGNELHGSIPSELGRLENLTWLDLATNQLSGTIPPELGDLARLQGLILRDNRLTGEIPSQLAWLTSLVDLSLSGNQLTGPIPLWLPHLSTLRWLGLTENQLTGPIPAELSQLETLTQLSLNDNRLTGPIPPELVRLANLHGLRLGSNRLTGPVPSWLGQLSHLQWLDLSGNRLAGPVPPELRELTNLWHLDLSANQLSGPIPPDLGQLAHLRELYLGANRLSGAIPAQLGNLTGLDQMDLSTNQLTGAIPREFAQLVVMWRLDLRANQLTGPIPSELAQLRSNLASFHLAGNPLTGCIPPGVRIADRQDLDIPDCRQT